MIQFKQPFRSEALDPRRLDRRSVHTGSTLMNVDQLVAKYESRGRRSGRILLFDPTTARELVEDARSAGVRVLGVDGFLVSERGIQPLQQCELDVEDELDPHEKTSAYLAEFIDGGLMFEVALECDFR